MPAAFAYSQRRGAVWRSLRELLGSRPFHMTAREMAVVESSARICVSGIRSLTMAFENGVYLQSAEYSTHTLCARTDSVTIMTTFRRREGVGVNDGTGSGVRCPG